MVRNEKLRDEIYCQLANQTWRNDNEANCERGWLLMANCLSCFPPSATLYKYLLKYCSDHAYNGYKAVCQSKLLKSGNTRLSLVNTLNTQFSLVRTDGPAPGPAVPAHCAGVES